MREEVQKRIQQDKEYMVTMLSRESTYCKEHGVSKADLNKFFETGVHPSEPAIKSPKCRKEKKQ